MQDSDALPETDTGLGDGEDRGGPARLGPWTVKGISMADREAMNAAARRAQMTLGAWLTETAQQRIAADRVRRVDGPAALQDAGGTWQLGSAAPTPSLPDLAALMRELPGLAAAPGCGRLAARARRVIAASLGAYLPAPPPSSGLPGAGRLAAPRVPALGAPEP